MGKTFKARIVDWKRNNKVGLRNFNENVDFHDLVKTLLVRILRRKYQDNKRYPIYTEFDPIDTNEDYPDIWMKVNGSIYIWEIQERVTEPWLKQIQEKHENETLIVVPLKKVLDKWENRLMNNLMINKQFKPIEDLRIVLEEYTI